MFAYIDNHNELTQSMVNQYNESLIFLGDEKQIFVPLINAYVGLGMSTYQDLLNRIDQSNDNLAEYNKYIHNDTVTSIYVQFSPEEIEAIRTHNGNTPGGSITLRNETIDERSRSETVFKANKNVVLKGFNDYELNNGQDELGNAIDTSDTSGITVSIKHNYDLDHPSYTGKYTIGGVQYSYTYYSAYDVITIDDTKTWSYIKASNTYLSNFAMRFATDQADQVYKNILGINDPVYIEKDFEEAFNYNNTTNELTEFTGVYIKLKDGTYGQVEVVSQKGVGYAILYNGKVIYTNLVNTTPTDDNTKITLNSTDYTLYSVNELKTSVLSNEGKSGYDTANTKIIPVWYHQDTSPTASSYINIADGIQTLKEVAYILEIITDGADDDKSINLTYTIAYNYVDIQKLKEWQNNIGNTTVSSFKSESKNDLLTVNYYSTNLWDGDRDADGASVGKVKLDLDLRLAQTYVLNGITYAAYLENHSVPAGYGTYWTYTGDPSDVNNYRHISTNVIQLYQQFNGLNASIPLYTPVRENGNGNIISYEIFDTIAPNNIGNYTNSNYYVFIPYKEERYDFTKGLTDVKWVTTYVSYVNTYLNNRINNLNVSSQIETIINELDATYTKLPGHFVTHVTEEDGIISVYQEKLPLDIILKDDVYYTNDIYVHVSNDILKNNSNNVYKFENGNYIPVVQDTVAGLPDTGISENYYLKTSLASMTPVPKRTTVGAMILNGANVTYFWKNVTNGYTSYLPLDIQTAYTTGTLFTDDKVKDDNKIYYWAGTTGQVKYFDVSTIQRENGSTATLFTSYITYLAASSSTNSGLADSWDVRRTIESMFQWVNIKTNKIIE